MVPGLKGGVSLSKTRYLHLKTMDEITQDNIVKLKTIITNEQVNDRVSLIKKELIFRYKRKREIYNITLIEKYIDENLVNSYSFTTEVDDDQIPDLNLPRHICKRKCNQTNQPTQQPKPDKPKMDRKEYLKNYNKVYYQKHKEEYKLKYELKKSNHGKKI